MSQKFTKAVVLPGVSKTLKARLGADFPLLVEAVMELNRRIADLAQWVKRETSV